MEARLASRVQAELDGIVNLRRFDPVSVLPYLYVVGLGLGIYFTDPVLLTGSGQIGLLAVGVVPLALVAVGQSLVIFTRGLDLSVGGTVAIAECLVATHAPHGGIALIVTLIIVLAVSCGVGVLNGVFIAFTTLQPFIVTLATWSIFDGVAFLVLPIEGGTVSGALTSALSGNVGVGPLSVPKAIGILIVIALMWLWVRRTRFMQDVFAIGSDESRARLSGVPLARRKIETYAFSGLCAGCAGIWIAAVTASGDPTGGDQFVLTSVAAVVIGGTSIFGGKGSAFRSVLGAIALLMIPDLVFGLQLPSYWSLVFQGLLLIATVATLTIAIEVRDRVSS
jgi:ribose transport system permease protein